ncbi:putative RNA-binding protein sce3 [Rhypophila decipiens]|uniref:RNA-binding protein sce3 n=1 Tax=Rhypophila decipiens TaxID=261697 RepID=A0AAN6YGZ0_9PEZI|nr:putative RNA-binding protein sce3 [Rhypophila decipiens]
MAPKKKETQKLSLGEFMNDPTFGAPSASWADEVEDTYGTQPLPSSERRGHTSYGGGGDRGYHSIRDNLPTELPTKPPFTAHLGNLSYDATVETVTDFFRDCNIVNVRIIEDREQQRPKGFAYAEFGDLEGLKAALILDGENFQGRTIKVRVADPPKGGGERSEFVRDIDWSRKGPLADLPARGGDRRTDFGERRAPREHVDDGKVRDFGNWERRGPLSPLPQAEQRPGSRDGSRPRAEGGRTESFRADRKASPAAWGPGEGRQDSRPPRREFAERPERPERAPTAAEKDSQWRSNMRPDAAAKTTPGQSREGSEAPTSPAPQHAVPASRPKLNLVKRTVSEAPAVISPSVAANTDSKASPFGAARPIDTAAKEREIEEKRVQALKEKKEAEEKAKEERRLAKEAAAKEAAEKAEAEAAAAAAEAAKPKQEEPAPVAESTEAAKEEKPTTEEETGGEQKQPVKAREPREPRPPRDDVANVKSRAAEASSWRRPSGTEQRAPSRGAHAAGGPRRGGERAPRGPRGDTARPPRANGSGPASVHQDQPPQSATSEQSPSTPTVDEDGWTTVTVPQKGRRGGRPLMP